MSDIPNWALEAKTDAKTSPILRFPPFPEHPNDTTTGGTTPLIPFSSFNPRPIQIHTSSPSGEEIDTLGIPTIKIGVLHEKDFPKTDAARNAMAKDKERETQRQAQGYRDDHQPRGRGRGRGNYAGGYGRGRGRGGFHANATGHTATSTPGDGDESLNINPNYNRPPRPFYNHRLEWHTQWEQLDEQLYGMLKDVDSEQRIEGKVEDFPTSGNTTRVANDGLDGSQDTDTFATPAVYLHRSVTDRIHYAATSFRMSRPWPPFKSQIPYLWDQIRLYMGLLGSTPVWIRTDKVGEGGIPNDDDENTNRAAHNSNDEDSSDYDSDTHIPQRDRSSSNHHLSQQNQQYKRVLPRRPYALYGATPFLLSSDAEVRELLARAKAAKERRLERFLDDPEGGARTLMSSYLRREGLVWSQTFLTSLPILLAFFLRYLVRNKVFIDCPTPSSTLSSVSQTLHDSFMSALLIAERAKFELPITWRVPKFLPGKLGGWAKFRWGVAGRWWEKVDEQEEERRGKEAGEEEATREMKELELDAPWTAQTTPATSSTEQLWDLYDPDAAEESDISDTSQIHSRLQSPKAKVQNHREVEELLAAWSNPIPVIPVEVEALLTDKSRCDGVRIRERSVRRIVEVKKSVESASDLEVLERHYARVKLEPWREWTWKEGDVSEVEGGGKVMMDDIGLNDGHDPRGKTITLLVEDSVLDLSGLCVGMGMIGTWAQLELKNEEFWFVEELVMVVASFWKDEGRVEEVGMF